MDDLKEQKKALRATAKATRCEALKRHGPMAGMMLARKGLDGITVRFDASVACFYPMPDEFDPVALYNKLEADGHPLALPVMQGKGQPLVMRRWVIGDTLIAGTWGIKEPGPDAPEVRPEIVLVPLLAFDKRGYRLGYGGGFYDRTLEKLRRENPNLLAIGLGFDELEVDAVPHDDHDQRLDWVLTPGRTLRCGT
ncbi:MAG: 5-formyltetrahydrofolate cyclo-ligase [Hyphomicrobium sp. 32-62-53]|nr:MAG: 5-formyltetrahydrofolate cyclo-ligase [Hyphomicrobium sp. 12-62-95]OYX99737.1 MAG: 5-formyltetrahydrofolate cyclo-ligase [Hyphomicrobium sp. 32-62-53]